MEQIEININGSNVLVDKKIISYDDIVEIASKQTGRSPKNIFSVVYQRADQQKTEGIMHPGCPDIIIKKGTRISAMVTDNA